MMVAYVTRVLEFTGLSLSLIAVAISLFIFYHFRFEPFLLKPFIVEICNLIEMSLHLLSITKQTPKRGGNCDLN